MIGESADMIDLLSLLEAVFFACLMTLGWSLMFNVPTHHLWKCVLITLVGFGLRDIWLQHGANLIISTFVTAMVTGFLSVFLARRYLITPKAILVPALLCMMPGVDAYKAMLSLVQLGYAGYTHELFAQMMNHALRALFVTLALVLGLSLPSTIIYRKEPIV